MPLYSYEALNTLGKKRGGMIDADSLQSAKEKLRKLEVVVTKVDLAKKQKEVPLSKSMMIIFTREISQLLKAGLPLYESLLTLEEKYRGHKNHVIFLDLCDQVKGGKALSVALGQYTKSFDSIYISMVASGENTGDLENTFLQLYKVASRGEKFKKQVQAAMIYPTFLLVFCLLLLTGLFFFLVPSMQELLEGRRLHPLTHVVLGISKCLRTYWPFFLMALFACVSLIISCFRVQKIKNVFKNLWLKVPLFRNLICEAVLMRFCRALSVLLSSGVPIAKALSLSKRVMNHAAFEEIITRAEAGLVQGERLSSLLGKNKLIPPLVVRMLLTAEETGSTSEMLANIADIYEEMLEKSLSQFTNLLQPVMLLVLGVLVGTVLLSVLLPLTDVSSML